MGDWVVNSSLTPASAVMSMIAACEKFIANPPPTQTQVEAVQPSGGTRVSDMIGPGDLAGLLS